MSKIDLQVGENELSEGYITSFAKFAQKYNHSLNKLKKDREELKIILHTIIEEIMIGSRPVLDIDAVAGRKTQQEQLMPYSIEIKLRLPEEIMASLAEKEFRLQSVNL